MMIRWMIAGIVTALVIFFLPLPTGTEMQIDRRLTIDSLGACQGVSYQKGRLFLYGDRETGVIREYRMENDSVAFSGKEMKLTISDTDLINHPTGIAYQDNQPVFIGNSIRLNKEGSRWRAVIYCVDWKGLQRTGRLDGNLLNTIEDDACIQGTRPEYVRYKNKWYVATADYGPKQNEVRLYDPERLRNAKRTSDKGVLYKKFSCTPWVQNLHWIPGKGQLLLIQNTTEGKGWRFTYLDLEKSLSSGKGEAVKVISMERSDELEGFSFLDTYEKGIAVSSARKNNVNTVSIDWK